MHSFQGIVFNTIIIRVHQRRTAEQELTAGTETHSMSFSDMFRSTQATSRGDMGSNPGAEFGQPVTVHMNMTQHAVSESDMVSTSGGEVSANDKHGDSGEV